ncbi:MAG: hypothetical protein NTZ94_09775 [Verrucomicrobia bacterium]|nr:hypothetical protein [Verrucomicrobiota bacterium]
MKKLTVALLAVAVTVTGAFAGTSAKTFKETVAPVSECKFRDQELQVDAFGLGAFFDEGQPGWGGGLGVNYFFTKFIGIGLEQDLFGRDKNTTEWATAGNIFLRLPICSLNLAPYALVGGGAAYGGNRPGHGFGHVGGGLEYRVTNNIGLFSDARYVYSSVDPQNAVAVRAGLRFAF